MHYDWFFTLSFPSVSYKILHIPLENKKTFVTRSSHLVPHGSTLRRALWGLTAWFGWIMVLSSWYERTWKLCKFQPPIQNTIHRSVWRNTLSELWIESSDHFFIPTLRRIHATSDRFTDPFSGKSRNSIFPSQQTNQQFSTPTESWTPPPEYTL